MKLNAKAPQSILFLTELMLSFLVFTITAAVCVRIFVGAQQISRQSGELSQAVIYAQNAAESLKSMQGDLERAAQILGGGRVSGEQLVLYYDAGWELCDQADGIYRLTLRRLPAKNGLIDAEVSIERQDNGIYQISFCILEGTV